MKPYYRGTRMKNSDIWQFIIVTLLVIAMIAGLLTFFIYANSTFKHKVYLVSDVGVSLDHNYLYISAYELDEDSEELIGFKDFEIPFNKLENKELFIINTYFTLMIMYEMEEQEPEVSLYMEIGWTRNTRSLGERINTYRFCLDDYYFN